MSDITNFSDMEDTELQVAYESEISKLRARVDELETRHKALVDAVKDLPVDEWVDVDGYGNAVLIGYRMQAQGEWRAVLELVGED